MRWGARAGLRGGEGKTLIETGASSSILDWLSGEVQAGEHGELDLEAGGRGGGGGGGARAGAEEEEEEEMEFTVGRDRRWRTVGSGGGRYG